MHGKNIRILLLYVRWFGGLAKRARDSEACMRNRQAVEGEAKVEGGGDDVGAGDLGPRCFERW